MEKDIRKIVKDKSVIFVGNSVEIMKHEHAKFIESHDIVVKFGRALEATPLQEKSLSSRVDVWVTGQFRSHAFRKMKDHFKPGGKFENTHILLNRSRGNFHLKEFVLEKHMCPHLIKYGYQEMYSDKEIIDTMKVFDRDVIGTDLRPSSGFLTILWFIEKVKTYKSLSLIGFDFFTKSTPAKRVGYNKKSKKSNISAHDPHSWHLPIYLKPRSAHDTYLEEQFVSWLTRTNQVTWHILSDLKKRSIKYTGWAKNLPMIITASNQRTKYYKSRVQPTQLKPQ